MLSLTGMTSLSICGTTFRVAAQETMNQALKEGWKSDSLSHMQVRHVAWQRGNEHF